VAAVGERQSGRAREAAVQGGVSGGSAVTAAAAAWRQQGGVSGGRSRQLPPVYFDC
jgi:hypothetical protein